MIVVAAVTTDVQAANISADGHAGDGNRNAHGGNSNAGGLGTISSRGAAQKEAIVYSPTGLVTIGADQNIALDAVESGAALPLDQIEPIAIR